MISIGTEVTFDSSHYLPDYDGNCRNMHGHTYRLSVDVRDDRGKEFYEVGDAISYENPNQWKDHTCKGMVMDLKTLRAEVKKVISELDHNHLNRIINNPTAENILVYIYYNLAGRLMEVYGVKVIQMKLWETEHNYAEYWG